MSSPHKSCAPVLTSEQHFGQELAELFGLLSGRHGIMNEGISI